MERKRLLLKELAAIIVVAERLSLTLSRQQKISLVKAATGCVSEHDESASNSSRLMSKILQSKNVSIDAHTKNQQKLTITSNAEGDGSENSIVKGDFQTELFFLISMCLDFYLHINSYYVNVHINHVNYV